VILPGVYGILIGEPPRKTIKVVGLRSNDLSFILLDDHLIPRNDSRKKGGPHYENETT